MRTEKKMATVAIMIVFVSQLMTVGCERKETLTIDVDRYENVRGDNSGGISIVLESDSLEEDTTNLIFEAQEWGEEDMGVDL